jgi:hypothetical protein
MENYMKKLLLILMLISTLGVTGCAALTSWWNNFKQDPVAQVQVFEQGVSVAISDATIAFQVIKNYLPANVQVQAQTDFDNAVVSVNHAMSALNDAVQAAVAAGTASPDFTALITDVTNAVAQVIAIVDQYTSAPPAPPSATAAFGPRPAVPPGLAEAKAGLAYLKAHWGAPAPAPAPSTVKK